MHHRLFIIGEEFTDYTECNGITTFREAVKAYMDAHCSESYKYTMPHTFCDWWLFGGRWSGTLNYGQEWGARIETERKATAQRLDIDEDSMIPFFAPNYEAYKSAVTEIHKQHTPAGVVPMNERDSYKDDYEDDVQMLTEGIYNVLLKPFEGESAAYFEYEFIRTTYPKLVVMDGDPVSVDMVGQRYIAVIDYHD